MGQKALNYLWYMNIHQTWLDERKHSVKFGYQTNCQAKDKVVFRFTSWTVKSYVEEREFS